MNGTVRESQRNIALFSATIIHRRAIAIESHSDGEWVDVHSIRKNSKITRETYISTRIHKRPFFDLN